MSASTLTMNKIPYSQINSIFRLLHSSLFSTILKTMKSKISSLLALLICIQFQIVSTHANTIGYIEEFSLAEDRKAALAELIPGTRDYYFYHALHAQNEGRHGEVEQLLTTWIKRHGRTQRVREIENRAALLRFDENPNKTFDYLKERLGLRFNHSKKIEGRKPTYPTQIDPRRISYETYFALYIKSRKNLQDVENRGLFKLDPTKFDAIKLRDFLNRLTLPRLENLAELIHKDLKDKQSRGFGSLKIHRLLTKSQLDQLLELDPKLLNSNTFVRSYLSRLSPSADLNPNEEPKEKSAWLNRQLLFARSLSPAFNSLKANILYHSLTHKRSLAEWNRELLLEYLALPRSVYYLRREWNQSQLKKPGAQPVNVREDFRSFGCYEPIGQDQELVRSMLLHFFTSDTNYNSFSKYLTDEFLKPLFAEAKLTAGKGDAEKWYSLVSTNQVQNLRDRIDLSFAYENRKSFAPKEKIDLKVWTKNIDQLIVKEFEINAFNYYLQHGKEVSTAIELDGLSASRERVIKNTLPSIRRSQQTFSFPELKKRGVYVVEFIGNGISSRALIRKGALRLLGKIGPGGHEFRILDESSQVCEDATLWLNGKEYKPTEGVILVPFSNEPGERKVILRDGDFASLANFSHLRESYQLQAGFHLDRESLRSGEKATLLIRPSLRLNGYPTSLQLLEECKLILTTTDHEGQPNRIETTIEQFDPRQEFLYEFRIPERLHHINAIIEAKVESLSLAKKVSVRDQFDLSINSIDHGNLIESSQLIRSADGYFIEARGKNGEALADYSIPIEFKHLEFRKTLSHALKTDKDGRIGLGSLTGIQWIQINKPSRRKWEIEKFSNGRSSYPKLIHATLGENISFPNPQIRESDQLNQFSLFEKRANTIYLDQSEKLRALPGLIQLNELPTGDFEFHHHPSGQSVRILVTDGENRSGFAVSRHRILEQTYGPPLSIASVQSVDDQLKIRLINPHPTTRLHVFGTTYMPAFDAHKSLSLDPLPTPSSLSLVIPKTLFVEERDIGEEYRYVLERQGTTKFPGNLLPRPGLILNPWSVRSTDTVKKEAQVGGEYKTASDPMAILGDSDIAMRLGPEELNDPTNLDYLGMGTLLQTNLRPDNNGEVIINLPKETGYRIIRLVAVDPVQQVSLDYPLPDSDTQRRELRMATDLNPNEAHTKKKQISLLQANQSFTLKDFTTSRFRSIDSLSDAYELLLTLKGDSTLREFAFLLDWSTMDDSEKFEKYRSHTCHELHFFLFKKDPNFFNEVVKPFLANKKEPTFLDDWFLKNDLSKYIEPIRFEKLNAFEKALLASTRFVDGQAISRYLLEKTNLLPTDLDLFDRLFEIALKSSSLDSDNEGGGLAALDQARVMAKAKVMGSSSRRSVNTEIKIAKGADYLTFGKHMQRSLMAPPSASPPRSGAMYLSGDKESVSQLSDKVALLERQPSKKKDQLWFNYTSGFSDMNKEGIDPFAANIKRREQTRSFYRKIGKVMEWAESNYYRRTLQQTSSSLVPFHSFWSDYGKHLAEGAGTPFLSGNFIYATHSPTEMLLALAVLDLPVEPEDTETKIEGRSVTIKAKQGLVFFHEQLLPSEQAKKSEVLMSQRFFRLDSRYRYEKGERLDNFVDEEFLSGIAYGSIVVLTNPTSSRRKLRLLLHLPSGSMPLNRTRTVRSIPITLEAYSTQTFESSFYFPTIGDYDLYPARASADGRSIASALLTNFKVVQELSRKDKTSWSWISQNGTDREVLKYLRNNNLDRTDLTQIAFRLKREKEGGSGRDFYNQLIKEMKSRFNYQSTLWSYSFYHQDLEHFRPHLAKSGFANQCGKWIKSPLLTLDPIDRRWYEQLEYSPLVHARAHRLGKDLRILNDRLHEQYLKLLEILKYKPNLGADDHLLLAHYLFAQDRIEEGLTHFSQVNRAQVKEKLQFDYLAVNAAFYKLELGTARKIAERYQDYPVDRWKKLFAEALAHLDEAKAGLNPEVVDNEERDQQMDQLADTEPTFSFEFSDDRIRLSHQNLNDARIRYYPMEVELLFSRQPFAKNDADHFTLVSADGEEIIELPNGKKDTLHRMPEKYRSINVMVEIEAGGIRKARAFYANSLRTEVASEYGRIRVLNKRTGMPLPQVYVKTYARMKDGKVRFYKDGYTDLRGKFEYASLSTNDLDQVSRFALLIIDPDAGAQIEETAPPTR